MPETALVVIARAPELHRVKTRLAAGMGTALALAVYRQLLQRVATVAAQWRGPVVVAATGSESAWHDSPLATLPRQPQPDGGLGQRVGAALAWGLNQAPRAIAIGTDCPGLEAEHLRRLDGLLASHPVAIGPAEDGGYWAVGVADPAPIAVLADDGLPWSTPELLTATRASLTAAGWTCGLGDTLADCDDADDFAAAVNAGHLSWPREGVQA